ncbi:MAG: nicotinate phosphoribosyltransferase, partial [Candidatus Enteromonas sp.]|nr:nicotinate phosphoribosyltransferase [Candidatus Enteromonas sp.]
KRVKSARVDSGDLARSYKRLRKALDAAGKSYVKLIASNSLDERKIMNMEVYEEAKFDAYGVGENLITSATDPVLGGVYKLVAVKNADGSYTPKMKCSDSSVKAIIPGKLMAYRIFDENGQGQCDLITFDDEIVEEGKPVVVYDFDPTSFKRQRIITPLKVEKLLVPFIVGGKLAGPLPSISEKKAYIKDQLENKVWKSELRPELPHVHYVDLSERVYKVRTELYEKLHGGKI